MASLGFSGSSGSKEYYCNEGHLDSILGLEDPLEKGTSTQSSILAWRISWTEVPGKLQSMGHKQLDTTG